MTVLTRAGSADLATLLALIAEFYELEGYPADDARTRRALHPLLSDDAVGQVWLIGDGRRPAGYAVLTWGYSLESGGRECLLDEIYVRDRGHGWGGQALTELIAAARRAGALAMFLETEQRNDRVRNFYRRYGFAEERSTWMRQAL